MFFFADIVHCWFSLCNRAGKDFSVFLPEAQNKSFDSVFWGHYNSFNRMAAGRHAARNLWIYFVI